MTPLNPKIDWSIVFELADDWEGHLPYWGFSIFSGETREGVGSADTLPKAMEMARELFTDLQNDPDIKARRSARATEVQRARRERERIAKGKPA